MAETGGLRIEFSQFGHFDSFEIYRSTAPMQALSLPSPIATGLKTMYYIDTNVIEGNTYYYMVRVLRGETALLSDQVMIRASDKDDYFSFVTSLNHFDNPMVDQKALPWALYGSAQIANDSVFIGGQSLLSPAGTANYAATTTYNRIFNFGSSGEATVEFFFKKTDETGNAAILSILGVNNNRWTFFTRAGATPAVCVYDGTSTFIEVNGKITINKWHHYAYVKDGTSNKLFIDGRLSANVIRSTSGHLNIDSRLFVGQNGQSGEPFTGYVDDLRISVGVARYSSDFDVPSSPHLHG